MKTKKIIVMDLDGTLLNSQGKVTEASKEYLEKLKKDGNIIVIATGRILGLALLATDGAKFANYIVCDAGAALYKNNEEKNEWTNIYIDEIPQEIANNILDYFDKEKFRFIDICEKEVINSYVDTYFTDNKLVKTYTNKNELLRNITKISHIAAGFLSNKYVQDYFEIFTKHFPTIDINLMQDSFEETKWLEFAQKGTQKYKGISKVADIENIKNEDIIAFGDGLNDIDMLQKCGVGVAMNNALPEVKEIANYITVKNNYEDGIVHFLSEYLKEE